MEGLQYLVRGGLLIRRGLKLGPKLELAVIQRDLMAEVGVRSKSFTWMRCRGFPQKSAEDASAIILWIRSFHEWKRSCSGERSDLGIPCNLDAI